jgi:hypothetical protein
MSSLPELVAAAKIGLEPVAIAKDFPKKVEREFFTFSYDYNREVTALVKDLFNSFKPSVGQKLSLNRNTGQNVLSVEVTNYLLSEVQKFQEKKMPADYISKVGVVFNLSGNSQQPKYSWSLGEYALLLDCMDKFIKARIDSEKKCRTAADSVAYAVSFSESASNVVAGYVAFSNQLKMCSEAWKGIVGRVGAGMGIVNAVNLVNSSLEAIASNPKLEDFEKLGNGTNLLKKELPERRHASHDGWPDFQMPAKHFVKQFADRNQYSLPF